MNFVASVIANFSLLTLPNIAHFSMKASALNCVNDISFVEFHAGVVNKDGSATAEGGPDKKAESASAVKKLLIESMLKSIHVALKQEDEDQHSQYCLHGCSVTQCTARTLMIFTLIIVCGNCRSSLMHWFDASLAKSIANVVTAKH